MKVSDVIKTPVSGASIASASYGGSGEHNWVDRDPMGMLITTGELIAHSINSHDALVDMVRRLRGIVDAWHEDFPYPSAINKAKDVIREADELLKKEE